MKLSKYKYLYPTFDFISAFIAWNLFVAFRKTVPVPNLFEFILPPWNSSTLILSNIILPLFWVLLYYISGYYNKPLRKTGLEDLFNTIVQSLIGVCLLFFLFLPKVYFGKYQSYYKLFFLLLFFQILVTFLIRIGITSYITRLKINGRIFFRTILIGRIHRIALIKTELEEKYPAHSHLFIGYIPVDNIPNDFIIRDLDQLGKISNIHDIIIDHQIEDVIIVLDENDIEIYKHILVSLNSSHVELKVNPELFPIIKGNVNISSLFQYPLINISRDLLPLWKSILKNFLDIFGALLCITLALPICLPLILVIKFTSEGPVIFYQDRIGKFGKTFKIIKFRSMFQNAEANGPQLATKNDLRITKVGKFMRRLRLDEIPNFINVLKGDMSLVGPRPERKFYLDQIVERAPEYNRLLQVKPGVTSWGQVKYGYAENIDEMIRRMQYDLLYIENMSLYVDLQILVRTVLIILKGRGR